MLQRKMINRMKEKTIRMVLLLKVEVEAVAADEQLLPAAPAAVEAAPEVLQGVQDSTIPAQRFGH